MLTATPIRVRSLCNLIKRDLQSLDFIVNRFFMKLFRTSDINVVTECQLNFDFQLPSVLLEKRQEKFVNVMERCDVRL